MKIEVVYALPEKAERVSLELPEGCTVLQAVEGSGLLEKYPEIDVRKNKFAPRRMPCCATRIALKSTGHSSPTRRKSASSGRLKARS